MTRILLMMLSVLLAGCANRVFVHDTKTAQDFEKDRYECQLIATQHVSNMGFTTASFGPNPMMVRDETIKCLEIKYGWREKQIKE